MVGRKNHYGSKSRRGTEVAATLYTILETAKLHDVDPAAYLHAAIIAAERGIALMPRDFAAAGAAYKEAVLTTVGPELDTGAGVVVGLHSHYVRLQGFYDKGIVIDDPGSYTYADRKITWTEARAMGYFQRRIVIR